VAISNCSEEVGRLALELGERPAGVAQILSVSVSDDSLMLTRNRVEERVGVVTKGGKRPNGVAQLLHLRFLSKPPVLTRHRIKELIALVPDSGKRPTDVAQMLWIPLLRNPFAKIRDQLEEFAVGDLHLCERMRNGGYLSQVEPLRVGF